MRHDYGYNCYKVGKMKTTQKTNVINKGLLIAFISSLFVATVIFVLAAAFIGSMLN
jgi:hypothetical protein